MAFRFWAVITGIVLVYSLLVFRVYDLQMRNGRYFLARAQSEYVSSVSLDAPRGMIYFTDRDSSHFPVVMNKDFPMVYAVPKSMGDIKEAARLLSDTLDIPTVTLLARFSKSQSEYELLKKKVDPAVADAVAKLNIKGVYVDSAPSRFYLRGELAAHLLGYVGTTVNTGSGERGYYGVEEFYNSTLAGIPGERLKGEVIKPRPGKDIVLTIDPNIQLEAERALANLVEAYKARGGSVIVEDPRTGKILAMGSIPTFDPNYYGQFPIASFLNPVTQNVYEPGSVFKVLTMAAGIDSGAITSSTTYVDQGELTMDGRTIQNFDFATKGPHGKVSMTRVIEHSLNTGAVFVEKKVGNAAFLGYLKRFGVGDKTGITLPGEVKGNMQQLTKKDARDIAFATASYGQGIAVTPLELIQAIGAIANGGVLMRPYIDANLSPQAVRRVVREDAAEQLTGMMLSAVDAVGAANISGYTIAGKTGTAYVPDFKNGGYTENVINTYVGFGPVSNPRFIILLKLDQPSDAPLAASSVVPAFQGLAQYVLNYYGVLPDRL